MPNSRPPSPAPPARQIQQRLLARAEQLEADWGVNGLATSIDIRISSRMRRTLGRAVARTSTVWLSETVLGDCELLDQVFCHELAHLAAFRLRGSLEPPHGPTWRRLVRRSGHAPLVRLGPEPECGTPRGSPSRPLGRYLHRCPVCQFSRLAARRMNRWRCAACIETGLDGVLSVERFEASN